MGLSQPFSPRQDWNDIEATLSKRLALNLDGGSGDPSRTSGRTNRIGQDEVNEEDDDDVVDGFLSESPEYQQMNLEKKIERYATQLQEMKSRMAKWQARRDCIKQLETRLKDQAAAFAEQEDAWEKEAMAMSSQFQRTPNKFQNTVVHNAGRDELERQRNKEALRQMIHGAADFEDEGAGDDLGDVRKSRRQRLLLLVRRFNPLVHDIKQIDARFGSSVSAYFGFCRWVMLNYLLLLVPTLYNVAIHVVELANQVLLQTLHK
ncbi:hypothetical protein DYB25_013245, partial [Aphanomyces astaci]